MAKILSFIVFASLGLSTACSAIAPTPQAEEARAPAPIGSPKPTPTPTPGIPNLQSEIIDRRFRETTSPIGTFDFRNFTYELPRGWQNPDGTTDITLINGRVAPVQRDVNEDMPDEEKAEARSQRRIGMSYVVTKFLELTGDGVDEAVVVLKIETGGAAVPQIVYIFTWTAGKPEVIWPFRTGDRADGGLKDIRPEGGELILELFGQDRFVLGEIETGKITGDEEQLCCPTHFTRSRYKWNGNIFRMEGKRLTFALADGNAPPQENLGDIVNLPAKRR